MVLLHTFTSKVNALKMHSYTINEHCNCCFYSKYRPKCALSRLNYGCFSSKSGNSQESGNIVQDEIEEVIAFV